MEFCNQYLSYDEYLVLGGTLGEMPFNILEFKARKIIDQQTFGRLKCLCKQSKEVKMCVYQLINAVNVNEEENNKASETVGSYSVSYINNEERQNRIMDTVRTYLADVYINGQCVLNRVV